MNLFVKYEEGAHRLELAKPTDVGYDLAPLEDATIHPGRNLVKTGVHILLPKDCDAQIRPRSGCSLKGMPGRYAFSECVYPEMLNRFDADALTGTIDPGYTGDVGIIVYSRERYDFVIPKGTRIAQLVVERIERPDVVEVRAMPDTERGDGGFGHTGV